MILFLGENRPQLTDFLQECGDEVITTTDKLTSTSPLLEAADWIISYGYRHILPPEILDQFPHRAINIHISYLPWNRGADPNLWSFLEDTPKGVTIHQIDAGIDTGDILVQQQIHFSEKETLKTSYERLSALGSQMLIESWIKIREGKIVGKPQPPGGSFHRVRDRTPYQHLLTQGWDTPVDQLIGVLNQQ